MPTNTCSNTPTNTLTNTHLILGSPHNSVFVGVFVGISLNKNEYLFNKIDKHSNTPSLLYGDPNIRCVFVSVFVNGCS